MAQAVGEAQKLPGSVVEYMAHRKIKARRTLNDQIEEIHLKLYETDEKYVAYLEAVIDAQAVEGSLVADNHEAARVIRETAEKMKNVEVSRQNITTIKHALGVVTRRYGLSRKERRDMVGGEVYPDKNGE